jgi:hypothetical protein
VIINSPQGGVKRSIPEGIARGDPVRGSQDLQRKAKGKAKEPRTEIGKASKAVKSKVWPTLDTVERPYQFRSNPKKTEKGIFSQSIV